MTLTACQTRRRLDRLIGKDRAQVEADLGKPRFYWTHPKTGDMVYGYLEISAYLSHYAHVHHISDGSTIRKNRLIYFNKDSICYKWTKLRREGMNRVDFLFQVNGTGGK
jgi:hypothetical protein